jgi:hypothetical protein
LNEARIWYEDCKANHPLCVPRKDGWPRRILDLSVDSIRLVNTEAIESTSSQLQEGYACLSYAWGTTGNLKTLKDNLQSHMQGIDVHTLPRTLADAVHVSRAFGLRYLWVRLQNSTRNRPETDCAIDRCTMHHSRRCTRLDGSDPTHVIYLPRSRTCHFSARCLQRPGGISQSRFSGECTPETHRGTLPHARRDFSHSQTLNSRTRAEIS